MNITIYGWTTRSLLKLADPDWRSFSRWFDEWPVHGVASVGADGGGPG
jgi:hypothetical protein